MYELQFLVSYLLVSHHWKICQSVVQGLTNLWSRVVEDLIAVNSSQLIEKFPAFYRT